MEERCEVLKEHNARFYSDSKERWQLTEKCEEEFHSQRDPVDEYWNEDWALKCACILALPNTPWTNSLVSMGKTS